MSINPSSPQSVAALSPTLAKFGQSHLATMLSPRDSPLSLEARSHLASDLTQVDWPAVKAMRELLHHHKTSTDQTAASAIVEPSPMLELMSPVWPCPRHPSVVASETAGRGLFAGGKVGFLLLAGGQGTRLGFDAPKGLYPILDKVPGHTKSPSQAKSDNSLFAFLAAGVASALNSEDQTPPLALMTSPETHDATIHAFSKHKSFGLTPDRVRFFQQGTLPAMDADGNLLVSPDGGLVLAPDGHGGAISGLRRSGTLEWFESLGCEWLVTFQVDNAAVKIADAGFVGLAALLNADAGLKVVRKISPDERVGVVARRDGKPAIVEYSELTPAQAEQRLDDKSLAYKAGSIAFNVFRLDFVARVARDAEYDQSVMPLHVAHKKVPYIGLDGLPVTPTKPNAFKFERFIFDMLPHAHEVFALEVAREREFLPVKDAEGTNSPANVGQAIANEWERCSMARRPGTPPVSLTPTTWHARWT